MLPAPHPPASAARGEDLFPISLLTKGPVHGRDGEIGSCVDAMAGCSSGELRYIVASEGGIAGMGETLRRIPWADASVTDEKISIDANKLDRFEEIAKDQWPAN